MVGFVLGTNPPFQIIRGFIQRIWDDVVDKVISIDQGAFLIRFNSENDLQSTMSRGPILFDKHPVILKKGSPDLNLRKEEVQSVDIWIRLPRLHVKYCGAPNLSKIASEVSIISMLAQLIHAYVSHGSDAFGLKISQQTSKITCMGISDYAKQALVHLTGYKHGHLPIKYLEVP
ncbi:hypothetical protein Cgig2_018338 [Carnegiea gigantea]|uniref:DUF4283 domain-containing protein n=1 Tax=Carnegiea gigantea TaxID=171969 RepID=A0A9Q1KZE0_9CARY|nr:hypothetical protein Cgig2_018338 [Carnegiea gigantea]